MYIHHQGPGGFEVSLPPEMTEIVRLVRRVEGNFGRSLVLHCTKIISLFGWL